jgi:hypothetical protein
MPRQDDWTALVSIGTAASPDTSSPGYSADVVTIKHDPMVGIALGCRPEDSDT